MWLHWSLKTIVFLGSLLSGTRVTFFAHYPMLFLLPFENLRTPKV